MDINRSGITGVHSECDEGEALVTCRDWTVGSMMVLELDHQRLQFLATIADRAGPRDENLEHAHAMKMRFDYLLRLQFRHRCLWPRLYFYRRSRTDENSPPMHLICTGWENLVSMGERIGPTTCIDHDQPLPVSLYICAARPSPPMASSSPVWRQHELPPLQSPWHVDNGTCTSWGLEQTKLNGHLKCFPNSENH